MAGITAPRAETGRTLVARESVEARQTTANTEAGPGHIRLLKNSAQHARLRLNRSLAEER